MRTIRHIGIVVRNIEKSIYFYKNLLGLKIKKDTREKSIYIDKILGIKNADIRTIKMSNGRGSLVELLYYTSPKSKIIKNKKINDIGCSHFAISVNNINYEYKRLKRHGIKFISSPEVSPSGYAKVAFCKDPNGVFVELVQIFK